MIRGIWRLMGVAGLILVLGIAGCSDSGEEDVDVDDSPIIGAPDMAVVEVNGDQITLGEVNRVVQAYRSGRVFHADPTQPEGLLQRQAISELVGQRLLYGEARRAGLGPLDEEVQDFVDRERAMFDSPEAFEAALNQIGLTESSLADGYRMDMAVRSFIEERIRSGLSVSLEEARSFYDEYPENFTRPEQVHGRHILIGVPSEADGATEESARGRIEAIAVRILEGEDFADVARAESDDPGSGERGGDLGFFRPGQMVPPFDSVAFALQPGVLSDPVRTRFGYHLIEILEKQESGLVPFEEIESRLVDGLLAQKTQEEVEALVESLRGKAKIRKKY